MHTKRFEHLPTKMVVDVADLTVITKNNVRNVPTSLERSVYAQTPSHAYPETWFVVQEEQFMRAQIRLNFRHD